MDFGFDDTQEHIKETAREFLAERYPPAKVRELAESATYDDALWQEIAELGWPGIAIAQEHGGQGLGMVELVILGEELGYACAPSPFLSNAAAGLAIEAVGSDAQRASTLPGIAEGTALGAVGIAARSQAASRSGIDGDGDGAARSVGGGTSAIPGSGIEFPLVPDAAAADVIVLLGDQGGVIAQHGAVSVDAFETIDPTRRFGRVSVETGEELSGDPHVACDLIAVALAAELTGVAQRAMDMAVAYAKEREQFGRVIGAYQAVSHRCAQMLYDVEEARSLTYYAAWTADAERESLPLAAAMAKARASDAAWSVTGAALQVHGGIGFTWEHDLHFFLKRARVGSQLYGTPAECRDRVATLAGLSVEPPVPVV